MLHVEHQPEIQEHDAAIGCHQNVRGLHISVHVAGAVQRAEAVDQLSKCRN